MALNIEGLLKKIRKRNRETEHKQVSSQVILHTIQQGIFPTSSLTDSLAAVSQVELVVLSHHVELRLIYSFYSRLGCSHPPDNIFLLSRLQFWRMLKDCNIHHHGITLTQIERFTRGKRDCFLTFIIQV